MATKNRVVEPLMKMPDYSSEIHDLAYREKRAVIFFVDKNFRPLTVTQSKIASCKESTPYRNHMEYLPRAGDNILIGVESAKPCTYVVQGVVHSLPSVRSGVQKIFIIVE